MTIDKIGRCSECTALEFLNRDGKCEWCIETAEVIYATGQMRAAGALVNADEPEAA